VKRILLFLVTNIAVLVVLSIVLNLVGFEGILDEQGIGLDYYSLFVFAAVFGMGGSFISLAMSKWMAKRLMGAKVISEPRGNSEMWLVEKVRQHAQAAGIGMPEVAIYDAPEPNAFATGARRDSALVAVSTGLLRGMREDEVDAVLAHEISHIANGDMVTLALIQGVVNTFVIFLSRIVGYFVDRVILRNEEGVGIGFFLSSLVAQIVLGILAAAEGRLGRAPARAAQRLRDLGWGAQRPRPCLLEPPAPRSAHREVEDAAFLSESDACQIAQSGRSQRLGLISRS